MADKAISQLNAATAVTSVDLFVLEQSGEAKKLTGQILENWLVSFADGHGGIQSITKTGSTGSNPVIDTYTILLADETTTSFQVVNGVKGDTGDQTYVWIRYAHTYPTADSDMGTSPDEWIGIYSGTSPSAPTHYTDYTWYQFKGDTGETGAAATITAASVGYKKDTQGTVAPESGYSSTVPTDIQQGEFLWTRIQIQFNTGSPITAYSVSRWGLDGMGSVVSVDGQSPNLQGNVELLAEHIPTSDNTSVQAHLTAIESDISDLQTAADDTQEAIGIVENGNTATHAISAGQYVIWKGSLYTASSAISIGTTLSSSNLTAVSNGGLNDLLPTSGSGYIKFPDGTAIQWAGKSISRNAGSNTTSDGFWFNFVSPPIAWCNYETGHPETWMPAVSGTTISTISLVLYNAGGAVTGNGTINWVAIGRWK